MGHSKDKAEDRPSCEATQLRLKPNSCREPDQACQRAGEDDFAKQRSAARQNQGEEERRNAPDNCPFSIYTKRVGNYPAGQYAEEKGGKREGKYRNFTYDVHIYSWQKESRRGGISG